MGFILPLGHEPAVLVEENVRNLIPRHGMLPLRPPPTAHLAPAELTPLPGVVRFQSLGQKVMAGLFLNGLPKPFNVGEVIDEDTANRDPSPVFKGDVITDEPGVRLPA